MISYRFTDTIGTSGSLPVDADTDTTTIIRWYNSTGDLVLHNIYALTASLGVLKPAWDEDAAAFLGIRVEVIPQQVPCPECVQGKHGNCTVEVEVEDDVWVECDCYCRKSLS